MFQDLNSEGWISVYICIYIYIYIYMSDEQNPRRGVLYKRMIGVCCCKFVVRFAWEAQESARAGARYINIVVLFCISEHLLL